MYPVGGKILQCTAKTDTRMMASQKLGTANPSVEKVRAPAVETSPGANSRHDAEGYADDEGHDG